MTGHVTCFINVYNELIIKILLYKMEHWNISVKVKDGCILNMLNFIKQI